MPKEIRFRSLVEHAGQPVTMTLWTPPQDNPAFMKAVRENRVMTVFQKPTGSSKDFGVIGFQQQKFAAYLVFPKPLPPAGDAHIIGIKYDLLRVETGSRAQPVPPKARREKTSARRRAEPRQPLKNAPGESAPAPRKEFHVRIRRVATNETVLTVTARTIAEAEENALTTVKTQRFQPEDIHDDVKSITEV